MLRVEYPRPSFVREDWLNLNGKWQFALGGSLLGKPLPLEIEVPFCPESRLSGLEIKDFIKRLWYRRQFIVEKERLSGRVLLHFGAVDYEAVVYVNGAVAGAHLGGFTPFTLDIGRYLKAGENTIDVSVFDDTRDNAVPSGKQSVRKDSYMCYYTRSSGIWQTVWLEFVPENYIKSCLISPDCDKNTVRFSGKTEGAGQLFIEISYNGDAVTCGDFESDGNFDAELSLENPHLWNVGEPELYDVKLTLKSAKGTDTALTYFGFRKIELKKDGFFINGKKIFLKQVLDQGYYPDGIYTAPNVESIYNDVDLALKFGFNGARAHQKVFEESYLYYADKKGFLVWGEFPNWKCRFTQKNKRGYENLTREWVEEILRDFNHPSIIGWCPLNEVWTPTANRSDRVCQTALYELTKKIDPSRPYTVSGGVLFAGDMCDFHTYTHNPEKLQKIIKTVNTYPFLSAQLALARFFGKKPVPKKQLLKMPKYLSEYGGLTYLKGGKSWGYSKALTDEKQFVDMYCALTNAALESDLVGFCYTQLYDVEQEQNGLLKYDRTHKLSPDAVKKIRVCNRND